MHSNITNFEEVELVREEVVILSGLRTKGGGRVSVLAVPIEVERFTEIMGALPGPRPQVGPKPETVDTAFIAKIAKPLIEASVRVMKDGEPVQAFSWSEPSLLPVAHLTLDDLMALMNAAMRVCGWDVEGEKSSTFLGVRDDDRARVGDVVGAVGVRQRAQKKPTRGAPGA